MTRSSGDRARHPELSPPPASRDPLTQRPAALPSTLHGRLYLEAYDQKRRQFGGNNRVRIQDTTTGLEAESARDPEGGRDTDWDFAIRNAGSGWRADVVRTGPVFSRGRACEF